MDVKNLRRNMAAIEGGVWIDDIPGMGDLRLRVRGIGYKGYVALHARLTRSVPREDRDRNGSLTIEAATRVMGEAMSQEILLEWDGLTDGDDPFPYDKEKAHEWLTNPETRPFLDAVTFAASVVENGREATLKAVEGNSSRS